jgi:hypothetical protein
MTSYFTLHGKILDGNETSSHKQQNECLELGLLHNFSLGH